LGQFYLTGQLVPSASGKSFRVFAITEGNARVFIGLVSRKELVRLLRGEIATADISRYAEAPAAEKIAQEPLNFSLELKP
jgi:hypothetical protein